MTNIPLVILLGIVSTVQNHLAKALERQGIEVFDQIKAKLWGSGQVHGGANKPLIYTVGLILNNTVFIWAVLAQPYGPPALFSSMYGIGLVFLMIYAVTVLKEKVTPLEAIGAAAIVAGTLVIGVENIGRADMDRFQMNLRIMLVALGVWLALSLAFLVIAGRRQDLRLAALAFGNLAGGLGSLDPFFKGVGQSYGGSPGLLPSNALGTAIFASSFVLGFLAFVITQIGFARKVRASLLVPTYNAVFIGLPVLWQTLLLPAYQPSWMTILGLILIVGGVAGMHALRVGKAAAAAK
jgi:drug/metabolite transporter (DMT)-like permease